MTKKQKRWLAGIGGGAAVAGGAALLMAKRGIAPVDLAVHGAKKWVAAREAVKPVVKRAAKTTSQKMDRSRAFQATQGFIWRHTGVRLTPKAPIPKRKPVATDVIETPRQRPSPDTERVVREAWAKAEQVTKQKIARFRAGASKAYWDATSFIPREGVRKHRIRTLDERIGNASQRMLPAGRKGAMNVRMRQYSPDRPAYLEVFDASGQKRVVMRDVQQQRDLARALRSTKKKKISETNINRILDQRRAMNVPEPLGGTVSISHYGGRFRGNPAGMSSYAAAPSGPVAPGGRKLSADKYEKKMQKTLRNEEAYRKANEQAAATKSAYDEMLSRERGTLMDWWKKSGYRKSGKLKFSKLRLPNKWVN